MDRFGLIVFWGCTLVSLMNIVVGVMGLDLMGARWIGLQLPFMFGLGIAAAIYVALLLIWANAGLRGGAGMGLLLLNLLLAAPHYASMGLPWWGSMLIVLSPLLVWWASAWLERIELRFRARRPARQG